MAEGLRERRRHTTREALERNALVLFARDGFDATTVEAIAAEAGVSPRTFFRYFAAKDEVLAPQRELRQADLRRAVLAVAGTESGDLEVALAALGRIAATFEAERETMLLRRMAAVTSPVLRGRLGDVLRSWEHALADALAERRGVPRDDLEAQVSATAAIAVWQYAVQRWLADDRAGDNLAGHLRAALSALRPG